MASFLQLLLLGLLAFTVCHYTLAVATVREPVNIIISAVFAVLVMVLLHGFTL